MQRYFCEIADNKIILNNDDVFHLLNVMRAKVGEKIEAVYHGNVYVAQIKSIKPLVIDVIQSNSSNNELNCDVDLYFCLAKGDKIDFVIQKSTELGVKNIHLVQSERSVVKFSKLDFEKKKIRFEKILKEASEQCLRNIVPNIDFYSSILEIKKENLCDKNFVAYEKYGHESVTPNFDIDGTKSISIFIGPEGGISSSEISYLTSIGFECVSLGKRILRTETAAVFSLSVISYLLESQK